MGCFDDFIHSTVVVRHYDFTRELSACGTGENPGKWVMHTVYGHIVPHTKLKIGDLVCAMENLGNVAENTRTTSPRHLHLSVCWVKETHPSSIAWSWDVIAGAGNSESGDDEAVPIAVKPPASGVIVKLACPMAIKREWCLGKIDSGAQDVDSEPSICHPSTHLLLPLPKRGKIATLITSHQHKRERFSGGSAEIVIPVADTSTTDNAASRLPQLAENADADGKQYSGRTTQIQNATLS